MVDGDGTIGKDDVVDFDDDDHWCNENLSSCVDSRKKEFDVSSAPSHQIDSHSKLKMKIALMTSSQRWQAQQTT